MKLLKKRGRPAKHMVCAPAEPSSIYTNDEAAAKAAHEANIQRLIAERAPVHWEEVAQKQETELNVLRQENEELARICILRYEEIEKWKFVVKYLESRIENSTV